MTSHAFTATVDADLPVNMRYVSGRTVVLNEKFVDLVCAAFQTLEPARTAVNRIVSAVLAKLAEQAIVTTTDEVNQALRYLESADKISFDGFKVPAPV